MAEIREDVMVDEEIALTDIDSGMIISYDELGSKPSINGVELEGAKTSADYGLAAAGASYTKAEEDTLLSAKADKSDTYTKAETDAKLSIKADSGGSYTKAEEDALLGAKADKADTYTKAETDAKLSIKADSGESYTRAEADTLLRAKADAADVYTKAQTDSAISAAKPDLSGYYTKAQTDSAISAAQPDLTPYAKTADVGSKLSAKADKTDTYTKAETDALLGTKADTSALGEYQEKLTAGDNINITDNTISADVPEISEATQSAAGLMPASDKKKLDGITLSNDLTETGANVVPANIIYKAIDKKQNKLTFDTIPTSGSTNPVQSGGVKSALDAKADIGSYTQINADFTYNTSNMSDTSVIGVSSDAGFDYNMFIDALENYPYNVPTLDFFYKTISLLSDTFNEVIGKKQDILTFDITPASDSTNPVTSDGIYSAINAVKVDGYTVKKDDSGYYIEV